MKKFIIETVYDDKTLNSFSHVESEYMPTAKQVLDYFKIKSIDFDIKFDEFYCSEIKFDKLIEND